MRRYLPSVVFILVVCPDLAKTADLPWQVNTPIVAVQKSVYLHTSEASTWMTMEYVGPNLQLLETNAVMPIGDVLSNVKQRLSTDNGKTWSTFQPLPGTLVDYNGVEARESPGMARFYDAQAGVLVETWTQLLKSWHTCWRISKDYGTTWNSPQLLRYEAGAEFDPRNPLDPDYLLNNRGYGGNNIIKLSGGKLLTSVGYARGPDGYTGSLCFIGTWNPAAEDYQWTPSNRVAVSPDQSRFLTESEVAQLKDGRVLVIWRGSNTETTPGRKWYSVSTDGGMNLSTPAELKYDDGSSFYSPSSYHRMIRSSLTDKLYWIGNITATPPVGPSPRSPLVIAEVSETRPIPSLKKSTVSSIDGPPLGEDGMFSNFSLSEDRQTHKLNLYMMLDDGKSYKYVVTFCVPVESNGS